jgi:hypothetical protein
MKRWLPVLACVFFLMGAGVPQSSAADEPAVVVGRVSHVEGDLLRYVPEEKDWVAVVRDVPFGTEDVFYSGSRGMAELIVPNGTWIRIARSTQIQFVVLDADLSVVDVASGMARFSNRSSGVLIKATSPFGYVLADPGTAFDFIVGDDSVEVVALKGRVSFFHPAMEPKFDVTAGSPPILADRTQVSSGDGTADPGWDRWNRDRDDFWAAKAREGGLSAEYLPPDLRDEAYTLEENGKWEMVPYEGTERLFWQPTAVDAGWSPFTRGRWTDWYGDQTWIPAEPFGYITHHYGNWIYTRNHWYWAPPVAVVRVGLPFLNVGFRWYPGRVSWIHAGSSIGWIPLAPHETYYCRHRWGGPHTMVVSSGNIAHININIANYSYLGHAVVVNRDNFFKVNNYRRVRLTNVNRATIVNTYRAAPLVGNTVIRNYSTNRQRYTYTNRKVVEKPHSSAIDRIQLNRSITQQGTGEKGTAVRDRVKGVPEGKVDQGARIDRPKVANTVVPASGVNRPKTEVRFPPAAQPERLTPKGPVQQPVPPGPQGMPSARPERAAPERRPQPEQPDQSVGAARVRPAMPAQPGRSETRPERALPKQPSRPVPPGQPTIPAAVLPAKPVPSAQPATGPEQGERARRGPQVRPPQPVQPVPPTAQPERVMPAKSSQPAQPVQPIQQPAARPERVMPARPSQPAQPAHPVQPAKQPAARPEHVTPAKPSQAAQPVQPAQPGQQEQPGQPGGPGEHPGRGSR